MERATKSLKISLINCSKIFGGGEIFFLSFAKFLTEKGHDVTLICRPNAELERRAKNEKIATTPFRAGNLSFLNLLLFARAWRLFRAKKFDLVLMNSVVDLRAFALAAKIAKIKTRALRRGLDVPIKATRLNKLLFSSLTHVVANSHATAESINKRGAIFPPEKIKVIYNGLDINHFHALEHTSTRPTVAFVGRLSAQKRLDLLLDVAEKMRNRGYEFRLIIAGQGEQESDVRAQIDSKNLHDVVEMRGFVSDVREVLQVADVVVFTSEYEGFCFAAVEAMLSQRAVVAFGTSSFPEIIINSDVGRLISWPDTDAFATQLIDLLQDKALCRRIGRAAREMAVERFTKEKRFDEVLANVNI